jgi:hypothetical protein
MSRHTRYDDRWIPWRVALDMITGIQPRREWERNPGKYVGRHRQDRVEGDFRMLSWWPIYKPDGNLLCMITRWLP